MGIGTPQTSWRAAPCSSSCDKNAKKEVLKDQIDDLVSKGVLHLMKDWADEVRIVARSRHTLKLRSQKMRCHGIRVTL
jgi:hypothetical protein